MAIFSASAYLKANPDVAEYYRANPDQVSGMDIYEWARKHWDTYGKAEGRSRGSFAPGEAALYSRNEYMLGGSEATRNRAEAEGYSDWTKTPDGRIVSFQPGIGTVVHDSVPQGYIDYVNRFNEENALWNQSLGLDPGVGYDPLPVPNLGSPGGGVGGGVGVAVPAAGDGDVGLSVLVTGNGDLSVLVADNSNP